jgi:hypothetical protein
MALSIITGTTTRGTTASASSIVMNLNQTPTVGNTLIVGITAGNATSPTLADNQTGNTYHLVGSESTAAAANVFLYYCVVNGASGTFTITAGSLGSQADDVYVYEVAGIDTSNPFTNGNVAVAFGTTDASGNAPAGSVQNTVANSIYFTCLTDNGIQHIFTPGAGWTVDTTNGRDINVAQEGGLDYQIVSTIANRSQTIVVSQSQPYNSVMAAFNAPSNHSPVADDLITFSVPDTSMARINKVEGY